MKAFQGLLKEHSFRLEFLLMHAAALACARTTFLEKIHSSVTRLQLRNEGGGDGDDRKQEQFPSAACVC